MNLPRVMAGIAGLAFMAFATLTVEATADFLVRYDSKVTIHFESGQGDGNDAFSGRVVSDWHRCESNRTVVVQRRLDGPDERVGKDRTDADGNWELGLTSVLPGSYYAKAKRKPILDNRYYVRLCKWGDSDDVQAP